jgi:predicted kinase
VVEEQDHGGPERDRARGREREAVRHAIAGRLRAFYDYWTGQPIEQLWQRFRARQADNPRGGLGLQRSSDPTREQ